MEGGLKMSKVDVDSIINMNEVVDNKERKFGSALQYYPAKVKTKTGESKVALFTDNELKIAMERAEINPEDIPQSSSIWDAIFG